MPTYPSVEQLRQALKITEQIEALQEKFALLFDTKSTGAADAAAPTKTRRKMSAATRAKMSAA